MKNSTNPSLLDGLLITVAKRKMAKSRGIGPDVIHAIVNPPLAGVRHPRRSFWKLPRALVTASRPPKDNVD